MQQMKLNQSVMNFMTVILGIAAGYFLTIQSLKVELASKAELAMVEEVDKKLERLEVLIKEGVVRNDQFFAHAKDVEARLSRIEQYLISPGGVVHDRQR